MKKILLLTLAFLPGFLFAQSALQQLEQMAGQSIHDVYVPPVPDPTPVDVDEDDQPQQSTHLKDYTPAQEQEETKPAAQPAQPKPKTAEEMWQEHLEQERKRQNEVNNILNESWHKYKEDQDKEQVLIRNCYERFIETQPTVRPVPQFSSVGERNIVFDHPKSMQELRDWGPFYLRDDNDTLFRADYIRYVQHGYTGLHSSTVRFLGMRLANGRVEWRMFKEDWDYSNTNPHGDLTAYKEKKSLDTNTKIKSKDIWDVKMAAEGKVFLLEMKNGNTVVIRPNGDFLCEGRNISFHGQIDGMVFVECDSKLYCSGAPLYADPILTGDEFTYYGTRTIIVQNHDENNQPYYRLATYGGKCYDFQKHEWTRTGKHDQYSYLQCFRNDGDHFIAKPKGKDYYVILAYWGGLYKGQKKYKTLEEAHAAWPQEKNYIANKRNKHPGQSAKLK